MAHDEYAHGRIDLLTRRIDKLLMQVDRLNTRLMAVEDHLSVGGMTATEEGP